MSEPAYEIIDRELTSCVQSLIAHYSSIPEAAVVVRKAEVADIPVDKVHCSSIGLAGDQFKVSLVLLATSETLKPLCPLPNASTADWLGEMANQLIGRLKNALIAYGQEGQITLPVTVSGREMSLWDETKYPTILHVATPDGRIIIRLESEVDAGSVWAPCDTPAVAEEGSLCLF